MAISGLQYNNYSLFILIVCMQKNDYSMLRLHHMSKNDDQVEFWNGGASTWTSL